MKTYAETQNEKPFDWNEFLDRAIDDDIDEEMYLVAHYNSSKWVSCACGNQCDIIPRNSNGSPKDELLTVLGMNFYDYLCDKSFIEAKETLKQIEQRSAYLIKQIQNEN